MKRIRGDTYETKKSNLKGSKKVSFIIIIFVVIMN